VRVVADTNVLVSGLLWRGAPHTILELARNGILTLLSSPALSAELAEVLERPKFRRVLDAAHIKTQSLLQQVERLVEIIDPPSLPHPVSRDADDDAVLALAVATRADLIVTGDHDLLSLGSYRGIPILDPGEAIGRVNAQAP
jgi:uncharacterized protein